jgi:cation transporter-like permease
MKKILILTLLIAIVVVNLLGWLVGVYSEVEIGAMFRIALIVGIMFIAAIFSGAAAILRFLDKETREHDPD